MSRKILLTLCTAVFCLISFSESQSTPVQWDISSGGNGHWYEAIYSQNSTYGDAQNSVNAMNNNWYLASVTSQLENNFILNLFQNDPNYWIYAGYSNLSGDVYSGPWIGALSSSNQSNDWTWVSGDSFSYAAWGPYEPASNGDRVLYAQFGSSRSVGWNDVPSSHVAPGYIIESGDYGAPIPEPTTMLLFGTGIAGLAGLAGFKNRKRKK